MNKYIDNADGTRSHHNTRITWKCLGCGRKYKKPAKKIALRFHAPDCTGVVLALRLIVDGKLVENMSTADYNKFRPIFP